MTTQLIVSVLLALVIIFVPYFIGRLIPIIEDFKPNIIGIWMFGFMVLALLVTGIGTIILFCKGLWTIAGHLLDKF